MTDHFMMSTAPTPTPVISTQEALVLCNFSRHLYMNAASGLK